MLKLVFVDMDGTFLNSAKKITPENLAAMDLAAQRGVQFVPCTGRNVNALPEAVAAANHATSSCDDSGVARYLMPILRAL